MRPETPARWRRGFRLYRRRTGADALGNETAVYDLAHPDLVRDAADGIDLQPPRSWNSSGTLGSTGARVEPWGETAGGVLEGYVFDALEVAEFDRLAVDGALYEVRRVLNWPSHRQLLIQRVKGEMGE